MNDSDDRIMIKLADPAVLNEEMEHRYPGISKKTEDAYADMFEKVEKALDEYASKTVEIVKEYRDAQRGEWSLFKLWGATILQKFIGRLWMRSIRESNEVTQDIEGKDDERA